MILCEWDAPEGHPGNVASPVCFRILSSSLTSVSIFSVLCYSSSVSSSVVYQDNISDRITQATRESDPAGCDFVCEGWSMPRALMDYTLLSPF